MPFFLSSIIKGYTVLSFSAIWTGSTLLAILSSLIKVKVYTVILRNSLIRVYTICHSQQSDRGLCCLPFSTAVWLGSTLFAILSSLIRIYTFSNSQQSDQGQGLHSFSGTFWSGSTLFAILISLIMVYTICHSQQSDQGQGLHCQFHKQSDHVLHYLPFSAAWSRSTLFAILSSLIKVYTVSHSQ